MTPDLIMGIDPGQSGGIALLDPQGAIVGVWPMPETYAEIYETIAEFAPRIAVVGLEKVGVMPGQGISSSGKFMRHYGFLIGILTALQVRREDITPQTWQKALQCLSKGKKAVTRQKAQQLFPKCHVRITDKIADSLLIAEHVRRRG